MIGSFIDGIIIGVKSFFDFNVKKSRIMKLPFCFIISTLQSFISFSIFSFNLISFSNRDLRIFVAFVISIAVSCFLLLKSIIILFSSILELDFDLGLYKNRLSFSES